MTTLIQRRIFVTGRVQGVGFRASTVREAKQHQGLRGYVRNLDDGRVEAVFLGSQASVLAMLGWCRVGPPNSQVTHLEVFEEAPDPGLSEFGLRT